jgi:hypothetical protein
MSEIRFNGRIRKAAMHTEVTYSNDTIWISGFNGWKSLSENRGLPTTIAKAISHESLHLALRRRIGLRASKTLDSVITNDLMNVDVDGLKCLALDPSLEELDNGELGYSEKQDF